MIDAHCHLQDEAFADCPGEVIEEAVRRGAKKIVVNGTREDDWDQVASLAKKYTGLVIPFFGLHPWYASKRSEKWAARLRRFLDDFRTAGVGEIGLDRWMKDFDIDDQLGVFSGQWKIAAEKERPVAVHCLKAFGILASQLEQLPPRKFLLHSYSGSAQMVPVFARLGAFFSVSGDFFRPEKEKKLNAFDPVPMDRLLVETDAPEMRPPPSLDLFPEAPFNHPANIESVYRQMADRREMEEAEFQEMIEENFASWSGAQ